MAVWYFGVPKMPRIALVLSVAALAVPMLATVFFTEAAAECELLLWLVALIPGFLLAYYRGWRGAATALAAGMVAFALAQTASAYWQHALDSRVLLGFTAAYIGITLGVGVLSERLHRARAVAEVLALTDDLTALPNRRHARMFLERIVERADQPVAVVMFDLDHFKQYNDRYGHPAGDDALGVFAGVLQRATGPADLSARYGGEEFLSVLSGAAALEAVSFIERVRAELEASGGLRQPITFCAGIATFEPGMNYGDLLEAADQALYRAKQQGNGCVELFEPVLA